MAFASDSTTAPARPLLPLVFRPSPLIGDPRDADELLEEIRRTIEGQVGDQPEPLLPAPAPLPSLQTAFSRRRAILGAVEVDEPGTAAEARAIHFRREMHRALDWGFSMLDALDLGPMALDVIDDAIATLDALDAPDEDREPSLGIAHFANGYALDAEGEPEHNEDDGTAESSIGWPEDFTARLNPAVAADPEAELDEADLEDDELGDEHAGDRAEWVFGPKRNAAAERANFRVWLSAAEAAHV